MNLCDYSEYPHIVSQSLLLINEQFSQYQRLFEYASRAQILVTEQSKCTLNNVKPQIAQLRHLKHQKMTCENIAQMCQILQTFCDLCVLDHDAGEGHRLNQNLLYNYGLMNDISDILLSKKGKTSVNVLRFGFGLLKLLGRGNDKVQLRLYEWMTPLAKISGAEDYWAELFFEVFDGNTNLCIRLSQHDIQSIIKMIATTGSATLARLCGSLVYIDGKPQKRNQSHVIRALRQNRGTIDFVSEKPTESRYYMLTTDETLMSPVEIRKRDYFCALVELIAMCGAGENRTVESMCSSMFSSEELLKIITSSNIPVGLRQPFALFFHSVYLTSTASFLNDHRELAHLPKIWKFIEMFTDSFPEICGFLERNETKAYQMLRRRQPHLHIINGGEENRMCEILHYVFEAVLPFLTDFYRNFFNRGDSVAHFESNGTKGGKDLAIARDVAERTISHRLLEGLVLFSRNVLSCLSVEHHVTVLLNAFRTIVSAAELSEKIKMPPSLMEGANSCSDALKNYNTYYAEELRINSSLYSFVKNVSKAYGGLNTVQAQLDFPSDDEYCALNGDEALPLGREFQQLVNAFVDNSNEAQGKSCKYDPIKRIIRYLQHSIEFGILSEGRKQDFENLDCKCMQIMRTTIHNEIVKLPADRDSNRYEYDLQSDVIAEVQSSIAGLNVIRTILPHLNKTNDNVVRETLAFLTTLLYGGNEVGQNSFLDYFQNTREETFFFVVRRRIIMSGDFARERRFENSERQTKINSRTELLQSLLTQAHQEHQSRVPSETSNSEQFWNNISKKWKSLFMLTQQTSRTNSEVGSLSRSHESLKAKDDEAAVEKNKWLRLQMRYCIDKAMNNQATAFVPRDTGYIDLILRLLGGLCDGQNEIMQEYMREQRDNIKSVNVLAEIVQFLSLIYSNVDNMSISLVTQVFDTLIEMAQGNHTNQITMFDQKVVDYINFILRMNEYIGCTTEQIYSMKRSIAILLIDMTEENSMSGHTKYIMESVSKDELFRALVDSYNLFSVPETTMDHNTVDLVRTVGFLYHHLLCRSFDLEPASDPLKYRKSGAFRYFHAQSMSVEIQKGDTLQRVYFTVSDQTALREDVMERIKWEVDRSSTTSKLRGFVAWAREIRTDILYQRKVQSYKVGKYLVTKWKTWNSMLLYTTFAICTLLLFTWKSPKLKDPLYQYSVDKGNYRPMRMIELDPVMFMLSLLHLIFSATTMTSFYLANRPVIHTPGFVVFGRYAFTKLKAFAEMCYERYAMPERRKFLKNAEDSEPLKPLPDDDTADQEDKKTDLLTVDFLSFKSLYYIFLLLISMGGLFWSQGLYSIHMLHVCQNNQLLSRVIKAVTLNGRSMLWVVFLGIIIFYIFTVMGFLFLRNIYHENELFCMTLWECFVTTVREGLMYGMADHFDIPTSSDSYTFPIYAYKTIYDICFFALITTIGLNIIFGIIVDTFSQLRDNKWQVELDMRSVCFICGRSSYEFEHHGKGFLHHVKHEHNMWSYLFFFIHLDDTEQNDLTCLELYVFRLLQQSSIDFFPLGRALTLSTWEQNSAGSKVEVLIEQVSALVERLKQEEQERARQQDMRRQEQPFDHARSSAPSVLASAEPTATRQLSLPEMPQRELHRRLSRVSETMFDAREQHSEFGDDDAASVWHPTGGERPRR